MFMRQVPTSTATDAADDNGDDNNNDDDADGAAADVRAAMASRAAAPPDKLRSPRPAKSTRIVSGTASGEAAGTHVEAGAIVVPGA